MGSSNVENFLNMITSGSAAVSDGAGSASSGAAMFRYVLEFFPH